VSLHFVREFYTELFAPDFPKHGDHRRPTPPPGPTATAATILDRSSHILSRRRRHKNLSTASQHRFKLLLYDSRVLGV